MKKLLLISAVVTLCMAMVGCGGNRPPQTTYQRVAPNDSLEKSLSNATMNSTT